MCSFDGGNPANVAEVVRRLAPLRFDQVVDLALYHPRHGFYSTARGPSRRRDFLTSPAAGPLFGNVLARALDRWWAELGEPDPFLVIECGAGDGSLAASVLAAAPRCLPALRYVLVERSEELRRRQAARLPIEPASLLLGPSESASDPDDAPRSAKGTGVLMASLPELPAGTCGDGIVIANELLDNLPFRLLERSSTATGDSYVAYSHSSVTSSGWAEVWVDEDLAEALVPASPDTAADAERLAPDAGPGSRIPLQYQAADWLRAAIGCLGRGRVVVIDYADQTPNLAQRPWAEWIRTYRSNGPGGAPLDDLGHQDVTCEVAIDQLSRIRLPSSDTAQAGFLRTHGLDDLVDAARREWHERAHIGDLQALKSRARITEAAALTDPAGLGAFRVLEWRVPN